ncbi:MAG: DUF1634 domain-containing protein [bacterium]
MSRHAYGPEAAESVEVRLGYLLLAGVALAAAFLLAGLLAFVVHLAREGAPAARDLLSHTGSVTLASLLRDLRAGAPTALVQVGLLVLILTPVLRVAATVVFFAAERDWPFVAITSTVLALLSLGLLGLGVEGPR